MRRWKKPSARKCASRNCALPAIRASSRSPTPTPGNWDLPPIFEVYPEVTPADISGEAIEKPTLAVTDAEVDKTIEVLRKQRTTYAADRARLGKG